MKKIIEPKLAGGFRDYLPEEMIARQKMLDTIRSVFERFGFLPLDTPGIEKTEILTGGDPNFKMHIYHASIESDKDDLALRFDLTVPLARVVAKYQNEIKLPFRRYQFGKVWRGERQQAGRYREFMQCDADVVGTESIMADAEIVSLTYEVMKALGIQDVLIRINTRKLLSGFTEEVIRILDKFEKQGWKKVAGELENAGLAKKQISVIEKFITLKNENKMKLLDSARTLMDSSLEVSKGIEELRELSKHLDALGVPSEAWTFDFSIARGLAYYTGVVFETTLANAKDVGSVASGGRYDNLVERFGKKNVSGTGISFGVDRLFYAIEKLKLVGVKTTSLESVIVLNFENSLIHHSESIAMQLRRAGINTELYLGHEKTLKGQLAYAIKKNIPLVIIVGSNEVAKGVIQLKDTRTHIQEEVQESDLVKKAQELLRSS